MHSKVIDRLFEKVHRLQLGSLVLRLTVLGICAWMAQKFAFSAAEKYDLRVSAVLLSLPATLFLIPLISALAWYRAQTQERTAAALDRQHQLKERLTTYVEFRDSNHPFTQALCSEIEAKVSQVPLGASRIFMRLRAPFVVFLVLLTSAALLPYLPVPEAVVARQEERKQIEKSVRKLTQTLQEIQKRNPENPQLAQMAKQLRKIAQELQKPETTKPEALKKLNAMQTALQEHAKSESQDRQKQLRQTIENVTKENVSGQGNVDQKEIEQLLAEIEQASNQEDFKDGSETEQSGQKGKWNPDQARRLKQAVEDYNAQKTKSERELAELQRSLTDAQKEMTGGASKFTTDSTLSERDLERGKSGVEDGPGTTNFDVGPQTFDTKKKKGEKYVEDRTKAEYEQLYEGQREKVGSDPLYLNSKWNSEDAKYTRIRSFGLESESAVEAAPSEVARQNQNESEVRKERIPAAYRKMVKKYLESIE